MSRKSPKTIPVLEVMSDDVFSDIPKDKLTYKTMRVTSMVESDGECQEVSPVTTAWFLGPKVRQTGMSR